jgi:mRNA-degrading endonuclease RelE of RelBE toxin-antitoxin system
MDSKKYEVERIAEFDKTENRLTKKKRFFSLPCQVDELEEKVKNGEFDGTHMTHSENPEPHDVYKLRLPNPDANASKRDGYRVYYMVVTEKKIVVFLVVYYKKETPTVSDTYIQGLIDGYFAASDDELDEV